MATSYGSKGSGVSIMGDTFGRIGEIGVKRAIVELSGGLSITI